MASSAQTQTAPRDSVIRNNLRIMSDNGWSAEKQAQYLRDVERVDPALYLGAGSGAPVGGGYGMLSGLGHMVGLGARGVAQGVDAMNALNPFNAPDRIARRVTGIPDPGAAGLATQLGIPKPQTRGERLGVAAAEALTVGGPFGMGLATTPLRAAANLGIAGAAGMAGQEAKEQGVGPLGQMAASLAVGAGVPVVGMLGPGIIRAALRGTAARAEAARQALALVQAGNPSAPVTLGQVASGGVARSVEGQLRRAPAAAERFHRTLDAQAQAMKTRTEGIVEQITPGARPSVEMAGMVVQKGLREGFIPRFQAQADQLYNRVWEMIPRDLPVVPANTVGLFARQGALAASARPFSENLVAPAIKKWADDMATTLQANPKGIPLEVLKTWRSQLREILEGSNVIEGVKLGDVKALFTAVGDDIRTAIAQGHPRALPAWDRASLYYRVGMDRIERTIQPLIDKNTAELAFKAMISGTRDGATNLRRTMHSLTRPERRIVASAVLRRMGLADPSKQDDLGEVFDVEKFLTRWNQFSPEAKAALFGGVDTKMLKDLNALAKAAALHRQMNTVLQRPGAVGARTAFMDVTSGLGWVVLAQTTGQPLLLAPALRPAVWSTSANLSARAFTNPKIVHWMVRSTKWPAGALTAQLALLVKEAEDWAPEDRALANELADALRYLDWTRVRTGADIVEGRMEPERPQQSLQASLVERLRAAQQPGGLFPAGQ